VIQKQDLFQPRSEISSGRDDTAVVVPMSFAQQRLWFLDRLQPGTAVYSMSAAYRLRGVLALEALRRAVAALVARHESLRTTFAMEKGEPVQLIWPSLEVPVWVETLAAGGAGEGEARVERWVTALAGEPFDLERGPLLRVRLLRVSDTEHVLVVVIHHVVSDGWSLGVLWRELAELYGGYARGEAPVLPELPIQYADYALWQRERLCGAVLERELGYWRERLAGLVPPELPTDRVRPAVQSYRGGVERFELGEALTRSLKELARAQGVTLYMVLLAAFALLLGRYSGQEDVALGSPIAGRNRRELEGLIGFFVNTLVLRVDLSGEPTFRDLLGRVWEVALGAYEHQELPFEKLVEELAPERDLSRNPLVQVMLVLQNAPGRRFALPGLQVESVPQESDAAKLDLAVSLREVDNRLEGSVTYARDLFDAATIERLAGHFRRLIEEATAHPDRRVWELELLDGPERKRILEDWSGATRDYPRAAGLAELFEAQVARAPEAVAVVWGEEKLTYGELNVRANRLAHWLRGQGVGRDTIVGIALERSSALPVAILGTLKAGGAYLPLDPSYPEARLVFMLEDAGVPVLLTQEAHLGRFPAYRGLKLCLDTDAERLDRLSPVNPNLPFHPQRLAYVIYTSGSTGQPKGIAIEHRSVVGFIAWAQSFFRASDLAAVLASTPVCFDLSVFELFVPLSCGGKVVLVDSILALPDLSPDAGVTLVNTVPSALADLLRVCSLPPSVRVVNLAGEPLTQALVEEIYRQKTVECVYDLYGPTEATVYSTAALRVPNGLATIGRPIANTRAYVLDEHGRPVPAGVPGELYLGGDGLARGYWRRPELSAERFVPDPFSPALEGRLYRTGDRARWRADGLLEFLGRLDGQVKLRGFRIELGEVEANLTAAPGVRQAAAILREDRPGHKYLVGYVVPEDESGGGEIDLDAFLRERLPGYLVPSALVVLREFPLTANGKLDRRALPAPVVSAPVAGPVRRTPVEEQLTAIWAEVLGVAEPGSRDNFFELGGHSLSVMQVVARIGDVFGVDVPVSVVFDTPTIERLAAAVAELSDSQATSASASGARADVLTESSSSLGMSGLKPGRK
jgi:amino acid adenylation domain-containing protein